jgi:O-glycosyl hydrolase
MLARLTIGAIALALAAPSSAQSLESVGGGRASSATPPPSVRIGAITPPTVHVDPVPAQTISGFGASGAWWPIDLGGFPARVQQRVADLLFGRRTGIGLSSYRYNIGGGGVGVRTRNRAPATFLVGRGVYDWSRDRGGLRFLRLAKSHGVPILGGFVNSAPPQWTTNGRSCGGQLTPGAEPAYARYLAAVVRHLHDVEGIRLSYVSPINEPDNTFADCGQEGMGVPVAQRAAVVSAVGAQLAAATPYSRVIADESSLAAFQFLPEVPQWLSIPGTSKWVAALAHHTYEFPTDALAAQVATLGPQFHKPLWMTEICCYNGRGPFVGFGPQYDPGMTSGVALADTIWQDLTVIGDSAFDWWTALSSQLGCDPVADSACVRTLNTHGWNDALLYYDPNFLTDRNYAIYPSKRYWVMGNFSRYVRPDAVRHGVSAVPAGIRVLAFTRDHRWTVIVIDDATVGTAPVALRIALPEQAGELRAAGAVLTDATANLAPADPAQPDGGHAFLTHVPAQSVTTYSFAPLRRGTCRHRAAC